MRDERRGRRSMVRGEALIFVEGQRRVVELAATREREQMALAQKEQSSAKLRRSSHARRRC